MFFAEYAWNRFGDVALEDVAFACDFDFLYVKFLSYEGSDLAKCL